MRAVLVMDVFICVTLHFYTEQMFLFFGLNCMLDVWVPYFPVNLNHLCCEQRHDQHARHQGRSAFWADGRHIYDMVPLYFSRDDVATSLIFLDL